MSTDDNLAERLLANTADSIQSLHKLTTQIDERVAQLKERSEGLNSKIESLLKRGTLSRNKKTAGTCRNVLAHKNALWRFLETDNIEPTNNLAEQMIRPLVIWRKTSFGAQSQKGTTYMERIMTTVATCKLQSRSILKYLTDAVTCLALKTDPPAERATARSWGRGQDTYKMHRRNRHQTIIKPNVAGHIQGIPLRGVVYLNKAADRSPLMRLENSWIQLVCNIP